MSRGGRRFGKAHATVESCHSLSAWGYFQESQHGDDDRLEAEWEFTEEYCEIHYGRDGGSTLVERIPLTYTGCRYGGRRAWFACPACGRRVAKVYLPTTIYYNYWRRERANRWLCRHCWDLTYEQRRSRDLYWCLNWRSDRIANRWLGEISKEWIGKKKGQHWKTFCRRADQYEAALRGSNQAFMSGFIRTSFGREILDEVFGDEQESES